MGKNTKTEAGGHVALYRKYRSKTLDEVIGQDHITTTLANAIKNKKIAHAYLFTGPKGTGKTSIARILAHQINDLPYTDESIHLDIIEIDAASNRRIDDIRDLRDKVHIAPISAPYKVYIIDEVHMLTSESFNALLKTLEEPPKHVVFILATTEVHKLPATIISRTQRHSFRAIAPRQVADHLKEIAKLENIELEDAAALLLAEHGGGSFRDSISLLDQISGADGAITVDLVEQLLGIAPKELLVQLLSSTFSGSSTDIVNTVEDLLQHGLTAGAIADQLIKEVRAQIKQGDSTPTKIALMHKLLEVSSSQYPQLKLEAVLLSTGVADVKDTKTEQVPKQISTTKQVQTKPATTIKQEEPPVPKVTETKSEATIETIPNAADSGDNNELITGNTAVVEHWQKILTATKAKHNPLYTVLRLATPVQSESQLTLYFAFVFHKKKLEEPKYKSMLAEIIREQTGVTVTVTSIVDKNKVRSTEDNEDNEPATDGAHASLITNVQDIMGGGEIVTL